MARHVGYPVELLDMTKLEDYFAGLEMKPDKFFENYVQIGRWWKKNKFEEFREKVNKTDWKTHSIVAVVNAFYNPRGNGIILPAGILQVVVQSALHISKCYRCILELFRALSLEEIVRII